MTDIYNGISVAMMKIGAALPILNESFRYWDDPGTWANAAAWAKTGVTVGRYWTGYDDDAAVAISDSSIPDDQTNFIMSAGQRFWNDNALGFSSLTVYYSYAAFMQTLTGGGGNQRLQLHLQVDDTAAFASPTGTNIASQPTSVDTTYTRYTGTSALTIGAADRWVRAKLIIRDAALMVMVVDNLGVMFNPFSPGTGYYQFTAFAEIPDHSYDRFTQDQRTSTGRTRRFDPSGGAENLILTATFEDEDIAFYQSMKRFYDLNPGEPGLPGIPLLLEPNLPGYPPTFMCNIADRPFPLRRQGNRGNFYGGTMTFEAVY